MTLPIAGLKLAWGREIFSLKDEWQKLRPFSGGKALATADPAGQVLAELADDRLVLTAAGSYLVMVQGSLRADSSSDVSLKAVVAGDLRFAGPEAVLPEEGHLYRLMRDLIIAARGDGKPVKFNGLQPANHPRPFSFWGLVSVSDGSGPVPVELFAGCEVAEQLKTVPLTVDACSLLAVKVA